MFKVELVWNREFDFVSYGNPFDNINDAINFARKMENIGDGECVKKTRIVDSNGRVVWQYGKMVK